MAEHALLTTEQQGAFGKLTQRERIDIVITLLVRQLEKNVRRQALGIALEAVETARDKEEAIQQINAAWKDIEHG